MLYICISKPRTSRKYGASSVSFCPFRPKNRPGEGVTKCLVFFSAGFAVFSKCFVVFSKCRIIFRMSFSASRKQPAVCFRRLKTLKLRSRNVPFFRVGACRDGGTEICPGEDNSPKGHHEHRLHFRPVRCRGRYCWSIDFVAKIMHKNYWLYKNLQYFCLRL